jgi:hypothetical protein
MYTARPQQDPEADAADEAAVEEAKPLAFPMHPPDWDAYNPYGRRAAYCMRCRAVLAQGTYFYHCVACLATRRIDEDALRRASADVVESLWPLGEDRLDARRWAHALITLWRGIVDPMLMRAVPYNCCSLEMTLRFMKRRLSLTEAFVRIPGFNGCDLVLLRARGDTLVLGLGTRLRYGVDSSSRFTSHPEQEGVDNLLREFGLAEGFLVVERPSYRARREDPVKERTVTSALGYKIHRLECRHEVRQCIAVT